MKKVHYIYIFIGALLLIASCSRTKDAALNRGFHSMNTKYNILYNGEVALERGLQELNDKYIDDYWQRLPIEPLKVDKLALPGIQGDTDNSNAFFERAEEKAVKAVQRHGMNIAGTEKNSQIDNAYLLLGKSRYYSQRFVPSLEAFTYVIKNYPTADLNPETRIWRAKTFLRINNEELALESLQLMLNKEELYDEVVIENAHTAIAMVYTEMDSTHLVKHHLKQAVRTANNREQTARNLFILGQIYREENYKDSSNVVFQQIIDMKRIPYKYQIHSEIEIAKNLDDGTDILALNHHLTKLINDRENRLYLDELYYQAGLVYEKQEQFVIAEQNFYKSVHAKNAKQFQQGMSYEKLGDLHFDKANFVVAGAYYDSVLRIPQERTTKRLRKLERKRNNLDDVIFYEAIAQRNDSILNLVSMTEEQQTEYFQAYVDDLVAQKEIEDALAEQQQNTGFGSFDDENQTSSNGKWYFYNNQLSGFGQQKFFQIWGNRAYEENWRMSDKSTFRSNQQSENAVVEVEIDESEKYDINTYLELIPTDQNVIDSLSFNRNDAYYNLGLVYKEQFKELKLASYRFEDLLTFNPEERLILPTKYHLYKIYSELNSTKSDFYKNDIVTNYTETKYAKIISDPESVVADADDENSPEKVYEDVYCDYDGAYYDKVLDRTEKAINIYIDLPILPKFELLRAFAIGKTQGAEAFKSALEFVALNYSNTEEGKKAKEVIETINKKN
ncbi:MAG: hypothetical protein QM478_02085 [Flavobacteriaceae bacterium]